jgi:hypothetical protein
MGFVKRLAWKARSRIRRRRYDNDYDSLGPEKALINCSPEQRDKFLALVRGAAGSLTGAITATTQSVFLPHFVVPAVFNFAFLGSYSFQIHTMRKWAKSNRFRLAKKSKILTHILAGIIIKLLVNVITLGHADFALIMDAITIKGGILQDGHFIALLERAQAFLTSNPLVEGLNMATGAPVNAAQDSIGIGGQNIGWYDNLSSENITELGFANQANDLIAQGILEKPADKSVEIGESFITRFSNDSSSLVTSYGTFDTSGSSLAHQRSISTSLKSTASIRSITSRRASSLRSSKRTTSHGDVPTWINIETFTSIPQMKKYAAMYDGPRAWKLRTNIRNREVKQKGTRRWNLSFAGILQVLFTPAAVVYTWINWYFKG